VFVAFCFLVLVAVYLELRRAEKLRPGCGDTIFKLAVTVAKGLIAVSNRFKQAAGRGVGARRKSVFTPWIFG